MKKYLLCCSVALLVVAVAATELEIAAGTSPSGGGVVVKETGAANGKAVELKGAFQSDPKQIKTPADWYFEFEIAKTGRYQVSFAGIAKSSGSDSGFYAFDDAVAKMFTFKIDSKISTWKLGVRTFTAGKHELKFWTRERGIRIVQLIIEPATEAPAPRPQN